MWGRRADGMLVAEAVRGSGKEMGPRDGTKPKAPTRPSAGVGKGNSTILEFSVSKRRQLRPKEIVAGVGGEPINFPLHSK